MSIEGIEGRTLDPQAVEAAEFARKNHGVVVAAEIAAIGLGLTSSPLTSGEVSRIASDPEQRAVLACLARIYVDSLKTVANQAKLPSQALSPLEQAARVINVVYSNPDLKSQLGGVSVDHRGRQHHFGPEMRRDEAKTLFAASVLYDPSKSDELTRLGEKILQETYNALPDRHPTKPLIGIELQLSCASRGLKPDTESLKRDFETLRQSDEKTNPHRVATVASWLAVWGDKLGDEETKAAGLQVFNRIISKHPEWAFMTESERKKIAYKELRRAIFRLLTPLTTSPQRRKSLYYNIIV